MDLYFGLQQETLSFYWLSGCLGRQLWGFQHSETWLSQLMPWFVAVGFTFFSLSLKWTYENGCIVVRRIKVSFLSVQRCFLRWAWHQWPDIISPAHSKLNVFLAHKPVLHCLNRLRQPLKSQTVQLTGCRADFFFPMYYFKIWPLTNWKPL